MIGLIPNVLVNMVLKHADQAKMDEIFQRAGIQKNKEYIIDKPYSDKEWQTLFQETLNVLNLEKKDAYKLYSESFLACVTKLFPVWFEMASNSLEFLKLQPQIHNSFYSGLSSVKDREKLQDKFRFDSQENEITLHYTSPNKHCGLYIELAYCLSNYYHDNLDITHTKCMLDGQDECLIKIKWSSLDNEKSGSD